MDTTLSAIPESYEDLLHEVFDRASQGFQVIDQNWRYVYVNDEVAKQGKATPEALIGRSMMDMYPGIESTPLFQQMKRVMNEKISVRMENEFLFPDGTKGWFQLFIHPFPSGIYIFSVDITDRKMQEDKIIKKIETLNKVFSTSPSDKTLFDDLKAAMLKLYLQSPVEV